jgi:hypothetical protein
MLIKDIFEVDESRLSNGDVTVAIITDDKQIDAELIGMSDL